MEEDEPFLPGIFDPNHPEIRLRPLISGVTPETWQTSATAAATIEDGRETQRERVYQAIRDAGLHGRTDDELQEALGLSGSSERPRRVELLALNRIAVLFDPEGHPIRRLTRTHRRAVVWVVRGLSRTTGGASLADGKSL